MAMTFQYGPNSFCEEEHARKMGYKRYTPTVAELEARKCVYRGMGPRPAKRPAAVPGRPAPAVGAARSAPAPRAPPAPEHSKTPAVHMALAEMQEERKRLEAWMVKVAGLPLSKAAQADYQAAKYRADELFVMQLMAR